MGKCSPWFKSLKALDRIKELQFDNVHASRPNVGGEFPGPMRRRDFTSISLEQKLKSDMREIRSLCDALLETHVQEDQCTNFLLWLLRKLPVKCLRDVCRDSGLLLDDVSNEYQFNAQWALENSRPDARIQIARNKFLFVETKRFPNALNRAQFENHITGGAKEVGESNCWFLFISGDSQAPPDLFQLRSLHADRIGFISWKGLLALFDSLKKQLEKPYSIILDEFLIFARYHRLGKLTDMNTEETKAFLAAYPTVNRYQEAAKEKFSKMLGTITNRVIVDCEEIVTACNAEEQTDLPCLYRSLNVKGWHTPILSAFIFLNILTKEIGVIGIGYQDTNQKKDFLPLWNGQFKQTFRNNPALHAFTWIDKGNDENDADYFKLVAGTSGKLFDPAALDDFKDYFYWGYCYPLEIDMLDEPMFARIASDAKEFLASFTSTKVKRG